MTPRTKTPARSNAGRIHDTIAHLAEPIESLIGYPGNPRRGHVAAIAASLTDNGQYKPITVREHTREILVGNHTTIAAKGLGWTDIAVTWVNVTDDEAATIVAVDNHTSDLSTNDDRALFALLSRLPDLAPSGYATDDLATLERLIAAGAGLDGEPTDPDDEWWDMPDVPATVDGRVPHRKLVVAFRSDDDVAAFAAAIGQSIAVKGKSIWFPERDPEDPHSSFRVVAGQDTDG